jgi:hypothetical protein
MPIPFLVHHDGRPLESNEPPTPLNDAVEQVEEPLYLKAEREAKRQSTN